MRRTAPCSRAATAARLTAARLTAVWTLLLAAGYAGGRIITDAPWTWDAAAVTALRGSDGTLLTGLMRVITTVGSPLVLDIVFVVALAGLLLRRRRRTAVFLAVASPGSVLLEQILKHAVDRGRPIGPHLTRADGPSWPSGHASSSLALFGALLLIWLHGRPSRPGSSRFPGLVIALGAAGLLIALIGISRVYLGVHFPTDVLASWLLAGTWLTAVYRTIEP